MTLIATFGTRAGSRRRGPKIPTSLEYLVGGGPWDWLEETQEWTEMVLDFL